MPMKQERGLSYKWIRTSQDLTEHVPQVRYMLTSYQRLNPEQWSVDSMMESLFHVMDTDTYFLFIAMDGMIGVGLMTAFPVSHSDGRKGVQLHLGYVDKDYAHQSAEIKRKGFEALEQWATGRDADTIFVHTTRPDRSFDKMISAFGFSRSFTVYEKEITNGKPKAGEAGRVRPDAPGVQRTVTASGGPGE